MNTDITRIILPIASAAARQMTGSGLPELSDTVRKLLKQNEGRTLILLQKDIQHPNYLWRLQRGLPQRNGYQIDIGENTIDYVTDALRMLVKHAKKRERLPVASLIEYSIVLSAYDKETVQHLLKYVCFWQRVQVPRLLTYYKYDSQLREKLTGTMP